MRPQLDLLAMELTRLLRSLETFVALFDHEPLTHLYRHLALQCGSKGQQWTDIRAILEIVKDRTQLLLDDSVPDADPAKLHAEEILAHVIHALEHGPEVVECTVKALEMPSPCSPGAADYTVEVTKESDDKLMEVQATEPNEKIVVSVPSNVLDTTNAQTAAVKLDEGMIKLTLSNLSDQADDMKQRVLEQTADNRCDVEHVRRLQKEYKALKHLFKQRKAYIRVQKRAHRLIARSQSSADCDHADGSCKKERRRLRRFQHEQSLRLQLLQSEDERFKMKVQQQLNDLRREYADSYLFANTFASVHQSTSCTSELLTNKRASLVDRATLPMQESMIWHEEDASSLEAQRKKLAYARELDQQIEMRKAQQHTDKLEAEAQDRAFDLDERSPAKWLIDGGYASYNTHQTQTPVTDADGVRGSMPWLHSEVGTESAASPWLRNAHADSSGDRQQQHDATFQDEASPARLRITDQRDTTDRLRERAQKLEWRRVLDEQVREKARIKRQEEEERRSREADDANEERAYLREQHLRAARRRYGLQPSSFTQQSPSRDTPFHGANSLPSPPLQTRFIDRPAATAALRQSQMKRTEPYSYYRSTAEQSPMYGSTSMMMPPPAPARERNFSSSSAHVDGRSHVNFNMGNAANQSFDQQDLQQQQQNNSMLEEYRALLSEIRREREELRQEREEVRKEKEEVKMERARLQLENERLASLVDAQRHLNDQQIDLQRQEQQYSSRRPSATPSSGLDQQYQARRPSTTPSSVLDQKYQSRRPSATPSNQYTADYLEPPAPWQGQMRSPQYSPVNQVEWSMRDLSLAIPEVRNGNHAEPKGMSMEDFMIPRNRPAPNLMDSPRFKRLPAYRPSSPELNEPALDQSLIGESVFVPVESSEVPRITGTASPTRGPKESKMMASKLRNSRVIKSRGFYPIDGPILAEAALTDPLPVTVKSPIGAQRNDYAGYDVDSEGRIKRRVRTPPKTSAKSPTRTRQTRSTSNTATAENEQDNASSSASLSKSLFQVQVLV